MISSASSRVSGRIEVPAMAVGVFGPIVLANPVAVVDLEDREIVRVDAGRVAECERLPRHGLPRNVPPEIDDRKAAFAQSVRHIAPVEKRAALGEGGAIGVVAGRRRREVAQAPWPAVQRVVTMHDVDRLLHLLPSIKAPPAPVARDRTDVVVECPDKAGTGPLANNGSAVRVVAAHDQVVVQPVEIGNLDGTLDQLKAVGIERVGMDTGVVDRHQPLVQLDTFPRAVIAVIVPAQEQPAIAVERAFDRFRKIGELSGMHRVGLFSR